MENNIINKISSIIITETLKDDNMLSLLELIELMDNLKKEIEIKCQEFIKKSNNKLSNNIAFFDYKIKEVNIFKDIEILLTNELTTKRFKVSKENCQIDSDISNKEVFQKAIEVELKKLVENLSEYQFLDKLSIKCKDKEVNINIDKQFIEIYMPKSPNWITMGKAFSLKYDINKKVFNYDSDLIKLEENIKGQEKLLFSKLYFKKNLLPNELQLKYEYYRNYKLEEKNSSILKRIIKKLTNIVKK